MRVSYDKAAGGKKKEKTVLTKCNLVIASQYHDWQKKVLQVLSNCTITAENQIFDDWKKDFKDLDKDQMKKSLGFGAYVIVRNSLLELEC